MATALTGPGVIKLDDPIAAGKTDRFTGMHLASGQSLRIFGSSVFTAFILERDNTSGATELKVISCANSSYTWTDLYTAGAGKSAYIPLLVIKNLGPSASTYSFGIAGVTVVTGETPPG